jgi:hypothetical protein
MTEPLDHPNNTSLRELLRLTGLKQAAAVTLFNRRRAEPVPFSTWSAWTALPSSPHWMPLPESDLTHARLVFDELIMAC